MKAWEDYALNGGYYSVNHKKQTKKFIDACYRALANDEDITEAVINWVIYTSDDLSGIEEKALRIREAIETQYEMETENNDNTNYNV